MKIKKLVKRFLKSVAKNRTESTKDHYQSRLRPFKKKFKNRKFSKLTSLDIEDWLDEVDTWPDGRLKAPDTRRANAVAFEQLQKYAIKHKQIFEPILTDIEKPTGKLRERIPTEEETIIIFEFAPPAFAMAYQALRQTGIRPGELCQISIEIIDWEKSRIVIEKHKTVRKTGKPRIIQIGQKLGLILRTAIGDRNEGPAFLNSRGDGWTTAKLSSAFRRVRKKAKLPNDLCLYLARHEHATKLYEVAGLDAVMDALNHSNPKTSRRYIKKSENKIQKNQDLF